MKDKHEIIVSYIDSIKNIIAVLSIIAAGVWSIFTFDLTLEEENAKARLEKYQLDLERRPVVLPSLSGSSINIDGKNYLKADLVLSNGGNIKTNVIFPDGSLTISRMEFISSPEGGVTPGFSNIKYADLYYPPEKGLDAPIIIETVDLFPNQTKKFTYLFPVTSSGIYQLVARLTPDDLAQSLMCDENPDRCGKFKYYVSDLVEVDFSDVDPQD